jgi:hypothetical protein
MSGGTSPKMNDDAHSFSTMVVDSGLPVTIVAWKHAAHRTETMPSETTRIRDFIGDTPK